MTDSERPQALTINELAVRARTTTRNVRAHRTRGILPPPHIAGKTAYYGNEHLARLQLIARLQERGFSLTGIRIMLDAQDKGLSLSQLLAPGVGRQAG
jgi:DNA-binding transcriptional MerR regulator